MFFSRLSHCFFASTEKAEGTCELHTYSFKDPFTPLWAISKNVVEQHLPFFFFF